MIINWNWYCITHQAGIDIEIGIAEKPYLVFLLLLILQIHLLSYWYWYCNCKTLLADVDIDVAIAIQLNPISLLVLVLQNHHLNIEDQTISEILVLRSPDGDGDSSHVWDHQRLGLRSFGRKLMPVKVALADQPKQAL